MTTRPAIIGEFKAGDPVPEWMIAINPKDGGSPAPAVLFNTDCLVLEYAGYWHLIAANPDRDRSYIDIDGGSGTAFAATKSICFQHPSAVMEGEEATA